ncbi:sigma-70 family RNA polymerase sigma factor (plasmid) [Tistrella mobilis]|uniref:RNA polymerase sigma factor n=1 Tax=Tistrella mobilis TaxID=171437 RepID=UPI0035564010
MATRALSISRLYGHERDRLRAIARRILGDPVTAEDLVQQAFVNLLGRSAHADPPPVSQAYITAAVRHLTLNHLRNTKRRGEVALDDVALAAIPAPVASPEDTVIHRAELRRLLKAIEALPRRRRQVFVLSRLAGLSYMEIAERMGISRNTVISQIASAMVDLDRALG